jgi:hypothetical protein
LANGLNTASPNMKNALDNVMTVQASGAAVAVQLHLVIGAFAQGAGVWGVGPRGRVAFRICTSAIDPKRTVASSPIFNSFTDVQTQGTQHPLDRQAILLQLLPRGFPHSVGPYRVATPHRDQQSQHYILT